jgi:hypothetical protein
MVMPELRQFIGTSDCRHGCKPAPVMESVVWQGNLPLQSWLGSNVQFHTPKSTVGNALVNMHQK